MKKKLLLFTAALLISFSFLPSYALAANSGSNAINGASNGASTETTNGTSNASSTTGTKGRVDAANSNSYPSASNSSSSSASDDVSSGASNSASSASSSSSSNSSTASSLGYVFDEKGVFSTSEKAHLEELASQLASNYNMGVYLLFTDYMTNGYYSSSSSNAKQRTTFASNYYTNHNLGLGTGKDGIMLAVAVDSRDYVTIAYGQGSYSFSDTGISVMEDAVSSKLSDDLWYEASEEFYEQIGSQLAYYARTGKAQEPYTLSDWIIRIAILFLVPGCIALLIVIGEINALKTAKESKQADNYLDPTSLAITERNDNFITTTTAVTPRHQESRSNSGGGWGGGGGGGFSSSGGGKF